MGLGWLNMRGLSAKPGEPGVSTELLPAGPGAISSGRGCSRSASKGMVAGLTEGIVALLSKELLEKGKIATSGNPRLV